MPECPAANERASTLIKNLVAIPAYGRPVNRIQKILILGTTIAIPAGAYSAFAPRYESMCFASGSATYRIAPDAEAPDFRVRIADDAMRPDLRIQLVDRPEAVDFVLVDDFSSNAPAPCRSATPVRTVTLDAGEVTPDVTVNLSAAVATRTTRIYVHSVRYSQQDAAALLAAMWKADRRREAADQLDRSKLTDRISPASTILAVNPSE